MAKTNLVGRYFFPSISFPCLIKYGKVLFVGASIFSLSITGLVFGPSKAQAQAANNAAFQQFKKKYPEAEAALINAETRYLFQVHEKGRALVVNETHSENLISLKAAHSVVRARFFDDNSNLTTIAELRGEDRSALKTMCGNYQSEGIFYSDAKICAYQLDFRLAGDTKRTVVEKFYGDPKYLTAVYFHDPLPVGRHRVTFEIPADVDVELKEFNFGAFGIKKKITKNPQTGNQVHEYIAENLAGFSRDDNEPGKSHVYPHILVLSKGFVNKKGEKYKIIANTDDLYGWYSSLTKEVDNQATTLNEIVQKTIVGKTTDDEKIKALYYWVQDNIRYIAFEDGLAGFRPESAAKVFQKRYGDCKGMANLLKEMLKIAGFDARLTWIGTQHIAYDYSVPSLAMDNHMICTVLTKNGQKLILDPTEKYSPLGEHAERIQNRPIMIENGDKFMLEKVPAATHERNLKRYSQNLKIEGDKLVGKGEMSFKGESRTTILNYVHNTKKNSQKELIELIVNQADKNFDLAKLEHSDVNNRDQAFTINYDFSLANKVSQFDNDVYVELDFYKSFANAELPAERLSDCQFDEKIWQQSEVKLQMPNGLKVKHLPAPLAVNNPDFSLKVSYKVEGSTLVYEKEIAVPSGKIQKANFKAWNDALAQLKKTYEDQVILTK